MNMPLWSIPIGTGIVTSFFFLASHMNYSFLEWLIGNGIISLGVSVCYIYIGGKKWVQDKR